MRRTSAYLFLTALFLFTPRLHAHAALLYFDPALSDIHRGDSVNVDLRLDTDEGECINTVDAVIHYDPSIKAVDLSRGNSILSLWVEEPVIDEENHTIKLAGGIPGGYCGRIAGDPSLTNVVLRIVFRSPGFSIGAGENPSAHIWVDDSAQILMHDGYGTPAPVKLQDARINLLSTPGEQVTDEWRSEVGSDNELPSDFAITLTKDDTAFSGRYFIVFNSNDKQSGIDHYEVMEEPFSEFYTFKWGRADAPWSEVKSPYVLKDQTLNSTIRVKAIDKAGNERIVTLIPDVALRSISHDKLMTLAVIIVTVVIVTTLTIYAILRRRQRISKEFIKNADLNSV